MAQRSYGKVELLVVDLFDGGCSDQQLFERNQVSLLLLFP